MVCRLVLFFVLALLAGAGVRAGTPLSFRSVGIGGGGAFFAPCYSPTNPNELFVACDMSAQYRTLDSGATWTMTPFNTLQVGRNSPKVQFTSNPLIRYMLDSRTDSQRLFKTASGGVSWSPLSADPTYGDAWGLAADPNTTTRVLVSDYNTLFFSSNGGSSFAQKYVAKTDNGLHLAGAFFNGNLILVGTNDGLLVSTNGGSTFALSTIPGLPGSESIVSFCGTKNGTLTRLFAVTLGAEDVYGGIQGDDYYGYRGVYTLDWGTGAWVKRTTGIAAGNYPFYVVAPLNNTSVAYLGGGSDAGYPIVFKTVNGGVTWAPSFKPVNNQNVRTGWSGWQGDRNWGYGELVFGLAVHPSDANRAAFTDFGFLHLTTDGGNTWRQTYVKPAYQNAMGLATPKGKAYAGNGLEITSSWSVAWPDAQNVWVSQSDIRGMRSTNAGASWSFNYTGHTLNSAYECVVHPTTRALYMGTSSLHDLYESTYLTDSRIDGGTGDVLFSTDKGKTWKPLGHIGKPVLGVSLDPKNPNRLYATVANSVVGGVYVCPNITLGTSAVWTRLPAPPRTEGHAFNVKVLNDGALVVTYSGRRNSSGAFTASSGVFLSTDGGVTWQDRSHLNMQYWTRDITVDPFDATGSTWYVGVFSGWGGAPNAKGGLFLTRNRGVSWVRLWNSDRVGSSTVHPANRDAVYVTTEVQGLWYCPNVRAAPPVFTRVTSFPFRQPGRVFWNPYKAGEMWVTTFGGGVWVGQES